MAAQGTSPGASRRQCLRALAAAAPALWLAAARRQAQAQPLQAPPQAQGPMPGKGQPPGQPLPQGAGATRTIRYYGGTRQVTVPHTITRVATAWEAQNAIIAMLGFGQRLVATTRFARATPAFQKLVPGIEKVPLATGGGVNLNVEELARLRPQILFTHTEPSPEQKAQLIGMGVAVASFKANAIAALVERVGISADILGGPAPEKARRYRDYFNANVARVSQALAGLAPARRVRLYHCVGSPLTSSGRPSLNQDWMDLAQVHNVAETWFSNSRAGGDVSIEQVLAADPDIIVAMRAQDAQDIRSNPQWRQLKAVRQGRVYANPRGMFWWCRETSEVALQFLWLASLAYPERFAGLDMRKEAQAFYRDFYGTQLDDAEIDSFLHPQAG